jgi:hypothetical protein
MNEGNVGARRRRAMVGNLYRIASTARLALEEGTNRFAMDLVLFPISPFFFFFLSHLAWNSRSME